MDNGAAPRPAFSLADHMRACVMSDQLVLLDLQRSRYLALGLRQWEILSGPDLQSAEQRNAPHAANETDIERLAAPLLRQRILIRSTSRARSQDLAQSPETSLDVRVVMPFSAVSAGRLWAFFAAACWVAAALRVRSLRFIVDHVASRASRLHRSQADDPMRLQEAVAAFETLRPLLFTAREKCLYDSLTLVCFLASEGLAAQWIIGVKTRPFAAHSWVQVGSTVLNDLHEHVSSFKPILVV